MKKIPIALNIDDGCALCHPYYQHTTQKDKRTYGDGHKLVDKIPNSFAKNFCDLVDKYGIKGKLSIIPLPGGENPYTTKEGKEWIELITTRLEGKFSFCCEMLTHNKAWDIKNQKYFEDNEAVWSNKQDEDNLREYIELCFKTLACYGVNVTGVTSPWNFGESVVDAYRQAISKAYYNVFNKKNCWYFLDITIGEGKPKLVIDEDGRKLVSIPANASDAIWDCIEWDNTTSEFIEKCADSYITSDGKSGHIIETIENGGVPCMLTHWTSLFSNGRETGLKVLELIAQRIEKFLKDKVEFVSFEELMNMCINGEL